MNIVIAGGTGQIGRLLALHFRDGGHQVTVTSRDYTQTQELLALHHMDHTPIGRHGGASRVSKLMRLIERTYKMRSFGKGKGFDLAIAHGSAENEGFFFGVAGIPSSRRDVATAR